MMKMTFEEFESMIDEPLHFLPVFAGFFLSPAPRPASGAENLPPFGLFCPVIAELHDTSERK